jgi:hypothetical protein
LVGVVIPLCCRRCTAARYVKLTDRIFGQPQESGARSLAYERARDKDRI